MTRERLNELAAVVVDAALAVHREMGPGLLEGVYQKCLVAELISRGLKIEILVPIPLQFKGYLLDKDYVIDILVEKELIIELKAVEVILPVHEAQIISYLRIANKRLGILINFNVPLIKNGIKRFVNNF
jgi:GxxExxY protein